MSIPKIIHYCWFGGNEIPEHDRKCIESWKKYCPDYEIIQWNEQNYDVTQIPYMQEAYEAGRWAFVSDYARLDILYQYGGIYLDTDVELVRSLDDLLGQEGFAGIEKGTDYLALGLGFGAIKGHQLLKELCDVYQSRHFVDNVGKVDLTPNPQIMTEYLRNKYPGRLTGNMIEEIDGFFIYPSDYFCPQDYETGKIKMTENTYSIHHYHASWQTECEKNALQEYRRYTRIFGETAGDLLYQVHKTIKNDGLRAMVKKTISHIKRKL